jgi:hypothetical protein
MALFGLLKPSRRPASSHPLPFFFAVCRADFDRATMNFAGTVHGPGESLANLPAVAGLGLDSFPQPLKKPAS